MAERVLTQRELNRALLARQLLLRREDLPVPRAIERLGALQAQWPPSPYVALWSRLDGFRRNDLVRAVERRQVVKATLMRLTLHLVTARDYLAYGGLFVRRQIDWAERQLESHPGDTDVERLTQELIAHAAERRRTRPELLTLLGQPKLVVAHRRPWLVWYLLAGRAGLLHGPESSVWRMHTGGGTYVPATTWLGRDGASETDAVRHVVRRYLAAFGPASRTDIAQWTGLPIRELDPALAALRLRRFRDEQDRTLLDLPGAPLPSATTKAPPRFLPKWDSALLAHDDRSRILPEAHRRRAIRGGDVLQTFLVDGFVAGAWRIENSRVALEPFEPLSRGVRRELEAEGKRLAAFHEN